PPELSVSVPELLVVDPGDNVEIECSVDGGDPPPTLCWTHSPGPMPTNARIEGGKLWIQEIWPEQAGFYNCSARNGVGNQAKKSVEIRVRALSNGRFWITPDTFHDDEKIQLNREVKVSCQVDAVPQEELTYSWYKNGRPLKPTNRIIISKNDQEFQPGSTSLDIIDMRFSDSATYTCVASLRSQAVPDISIDVNISTNIVPPAIEVLSDVVQAEEGTVAELRCVASGKPKPVVLWSQLDKEQSLTWGEEERESLDGTLRMDNVSREMSGTYRCRTGQYNSLNVKPREGFVQLNVLYPPTAEPRYEDVRQRLGRSVTLSCKLVSGNPLRVTSAVWTFSGIPVETSPTEAQLISEWKIDRLSAKKYGLYRCTLSNEVASDSCLFNLTARAYEPEFYYDTPSPVRIQKSNLYMYILQWTQKLPNSVGDVVKYKLEIQQELVHWDPGHWDRVHWELVHWDRVHWELVHWELVHWDRVYWDRIHWDWLHWDRGR
ncbi:MAM domain-containing glycosylphosphatidylinositol anchor protein 1-like, partial [Cetorhinus maximus]